MYKSISLCFILLETVSVLANTESPWGYFNKPKDLSNFPKFNLAQSAQDNVPDFSEDFFARNDKLSSPQIETGFVPSFGHFGDHRHSQSSKVYGYSKPVKHPTLHRAPYRNKNKIYHKHPISQPTTHVNRYHPNVNPVTKGKYSTSIYKPNFVVGTHLSQLRDDPLYHKIRSNVHNNAKRIKIKEKYPNAVNGDVLQKQQHEYFEPQFEKYVVQNEPQYYKKPQEHNNINYDAIQQKNRYPLPNYGNIKIHPNAYNPLKNHISQLRQTQHNTFSEGNNDYPENRGEDKLQEDEQKVLAGGQDILDAQNDKFDAQNLNFNNHFSSHVNKYHPGSKLLPQTPPHEDDGDVSDTGTDFIPIKTYAQVRHTETTQHLPREAAYEDAETFDEVLNAPRLREAVKTSKAQTVYTEEGYEDVAYDHAGHLKHASNQEGYSGYLKGKDDTSGKESKGKSGNKHGSAGKSKHGYDLSKGKKWSLDEGANEEFNNKDNFSLKEGVYDSKTQDLAGAGSSKLLKNDRLKHNTTEDAHIKVKENSTRNRSVSKKKHKNIVKESEQSKNNKQTAASSQNNKPKVFGKLIARVPVDSNVEIFDTGFEFNKGPKHGGNYHVHPTLYNHNKNSEKLKLPEKIKSAYKTKNNERDLNINGHAKHIGGKEYKGVPNKNEPYISNASNDNEWVGLQKDPSEKLLAVPEKRDQYPVTSEVEVFKSELMSDNAPKHGGNYRSSGESEKKSEKYSELEDLNSSDEYLHGGNYKNQQDTEDSEGNASQDNDENERINMEEGLPTSIINNIAFLTSNMTVPSNL